MSTLVAAQNSLDTAKERLTIELSQGIPKRWAHQQQTLEFSRDNAVVFDTSDPGTGKTRGHLDVFAERLSAGISEKLLVVCPKSLMLPAWVADVRKFTPTLPVSPAFAENRADAFEEDVPIYLINTDGVKWLNKQTPGWWKRHFPANASLVIDESTAFKHHTSQRSRAAKSVSKYFKYRTALTGTPITSSITNIWHQVMLLDRGARLGTSFTAFRNSTQVDVRRGRFTQWRDKEGIEEVVSFMLRDITIRHQFDEVMDVPENYSRTLSFTPSAKTLAVYEELEENAFLEFSKGDVSAVNAAVLRNKLLQVASGAVYGEGGKVHVLDTGRYELVADLVEERDASVVFFNWAHQRDELHKALTKRGLSHEIIDGSVPNKERARIVDAFQAGDLRAVLLHPQTGAHGLTLTRGRTTIWASPRYEPDFMKQGVHRVYRGGQTHKTENIMIAAEGTVDELVYEALSAKYTRMVSMLDLLKERRNVRT